MLARKSAVAEKHNLNDSEIVDYLSTSEHLATATLPVASPYSLLSGPLTNCRLCKRIPVNLVLEIEKVNRLPLGGIILGPPIIEPQLWPSGLGRLRPQVLVPHFLVLKHYHKFC